ncbi:MAG: hypothetical protein V3T67_02450 [Nitrosopumilaceae archaeon]
MKVLILSVFLIFTSMGYVFADPITAQVSSQEKIHFVDEQIMIMADISNNQDVQQDFAYITQVKNDKDVVISLSWLTGSLSPRQSFSPAQSWIPKESGNYQIQVFVWESISNPEALSPPLSMTINVREMNS